ncbi:peptide ABC transporter, ATP-binding protein [Streptomyces sp. e14]|nr:peptide ABC transporter, ATP-binding protein [Streptomyces sp. e14]
MRRLLRRPDRAGDPRGDPLPADRALVPHPRPGLAPAGRRLAGADRGAHRVRLDVHGAGDLVGVDLAARAGLREGRRVHGGGPAAHHPAPHHPQPRLAADRQPDARRRGDRPQRNRPVFPRIRRPDPGRLARHHARRRRDHRHQRPLALRVPGGAARPAHRVDDPHRRRPARRPRPHLGDRLGRRPTMTLATPQLDPASHEGARPVLSVRDLRVTFPSEAGPVQAVRGVGFDLMPGRTLCVVGESGSGKSATAMGIMGLLPPSAGLSGQVLLEGQDLVGLDDRALSRIRGRSIGMVFQDPLSALTPIYSVGRLLSDALRVHQDLTRRAAWEQAVQLLDLVGIPDPRGRAAAFPHEFSGGMRQRVVIALAIANRPAVLVADEPTTALDVTVQAQILDVLRLAQRETGAGLVLITHDLGVVAGHADDVAVMYAGRFVEHAGVTELFRRPAMPYTARLLAAAPTVDGGTRRPLVPIGGEPPALVDLPGGCPFAPRCAVALDACRTAEPELRQVTGHGEVACLRATEIADGSLDPKGDTAPVEPRSPEGRAAAG